MSSTTKSRRPGCQLIGPNRIGDGGSDRKTGSPNPGFEFGQRKRLDQIIPCTRFEAGQLVFDLAGVP